MMVKPKKIDGLLNVEEFHKIENTLQLVISLPDSNKVYLRIVRTNLGKYFVVDDDDVFFPNIAILALTVMICLIQLRLTAKMKSDLSYLHQ